MRYGLIGEKLGHSFSPQIHRALSGYDYQLLPTPPEQVEELLRREPRPAPRLALDPAATDFYAFTADSFRLEGYEPWAFGERIEVAV